LPDDQREAVILIGASGFSYEEAADICSMRGGDDEEPGEPGADAVAGHPAGSAGEADYGPDAVSAQVTTHNHSF
jgi:RNA polymerase sigma-70 factor (ECF subfamily)